MDIEVARAPEIKKKIQFDDALTLTKFGKFNYILIFISGIILSSVLLETLGISFVLPVAECDMKLTTEDKGILSAISFAGIITSSHLWGFLADTKGRRKVILPTLFITFLCTAMSSLTTNFWLFVALRYFSGFFISGSSATIYAYLGEFHNRKNCSRAIMGASVIFGVGCMLLPALAWLVINQDWFFYIPIIGTLYKPWRLFLLVCGLPSLICSLALIKLPESPKFTLGQGLQEQTIEILRTVYSLNTGKDKDTLVVTSIAEETTTSIRKKTVENSKSAFDIFKSMWAQTAPIFMPPHLRNTVIACTLQFGIFATSNGMYMWFPDILNRVAEFTAENPDKRTTICEVIMSKRNSLNSTMECNENLDISTYEKTFILELLYAIGFAVIGLVINAVGKLPILIVILVGCGSFGIITVFTDFPMLSMYFYLILLLCGLAVTIVNAATVDLYPTNLRAMAVCISLMCGRLGSVVGANIVGILLDNYCSATFLMSGISLIVCGVLAFFIPNITKIPIDRKLSISSFASLGHGHANSNL